MQIIQQHCSQLPQPQGCKGSTPSSSAPAAAWGWGLYLRGQGRDPLSLHAVSPMLSHPPPMTSLPQLQVLPPSSKSMNPSSSSLPPRVPLLSLIPYL